MSIDLIESPSFLAKLRWIALTSLPESKSANTAFFQKTIVYWTHKTCARLVLRFLPSLPVLAVVLDFYYPQYFQLPFF